MLFNHDILYLVIKSLDLEINSVGIINLVLSTIYTVEVKVREGFLAKKHKTLRVQLKKTSNN